MTERPWAKTRESACVFEGLWEDWAKRIKNEGRPKVAEEEVEATLNLSQDQTGITRKL